MKTQQVRELIRFFSRIEIIHSLGLSGKIKRNTVLDTIDAWGPNFRVTFDLMVHSNVKSTLSSVLAFRGNDGTRNKVQDGDRIPTVSYNSKKGQLVFREDLFHKNE